MSLKLPARNIGPWAKDLIDECLVSREARRDQTKIWTSYYYNGSADGNQAIYNRTFSHIDRLASFLYSPTDTRYVLEGDPSEDAAAVDLLQRGNRHLNAEFNRTNSDLAFAAGVNWALVKGCVLIKQTWGHEGLEPYIIQPELFGVLREDIAELDRQEAFVETTYLTKSAFARSLGDIEERERNEILDQIDSYISSNVKDDSLFDDYLLNIVVGGVAPVSTTTSAGNAMVNVSSVPRPLLAPTVAKRLIRMDELWVLDKERGDYTALRLVGDVVVEGKIKRRNLCNVKGEQPYTKVCPNEVEGYFWGQSEIVQIYKLQERLNSQIDTLQKVTALKADPPKFFSGLSGITETKYNAMRTPGGYLFDDNPNAKVQPVPPDVPPELLIEAIKETISYFDDVAGFTPILMGQGEQGVRSQAQASTLARNSSPRMRDRALLLERQAVEYGEFSLKLMATKECEVMTTEQKQVFWLDQMMALNFRTTIDSHTSSPAFSEDTRNLAVMLRRLGVIDEESTIMLTHPPHEDLLVIKARAKAAAQAQMIAQHPELLTKGKGAGKK